LCLGKIPSAFSFIAFQRAQIGWPNELLTFKASRFRFKFSAGRNFGETQVSGWTGIEACFHLGQSRRKITQNNRSEVASEAEDAAALKPQAVAEAPCFRRAGPFGSERIEQMPKSEASASVTYDQFCTEKDILGGAT
jgi:hypothetical protein